LRNKRVGVCGTLLKKFFRQPVDESMNVLK